MNRVKLFFCALLLSGFGASSIAQSGGDVAAADLTKALSALAPNLQPDAIAETPVPGLYELTFGTKVVYITSDGRYLLRGSIMDLQQRVELTEQRESELQRQLLDGLDESQMITYGDEDSPHTVTVFTDIDCGYCRKLHSEIEDYNAAGIRIRYLAFPRAGLGSASAQKYESVWCADDRHVAMDQAKTGQELPARRCENPVAAQYNLGRDLGISGTPALILEDGSIVPGYVPAAKLAEALDKQAAKVAASPGDNSESTN